MSDKTEVTAEQFGFCTLVCFKRAIEIIRSVPNSAVEELRRELLASGPRRRMSNFDRGELGCLWIKAAGYEIWKQLKDSELIKDLPKEQQDGLREMFEP